MTHKSQYEMSDNRFLVRAPGKLNLTLLVAGKRADGYHELETIMAKVNWYDEIIIEAGHEAGIELVCSGPYWAPAGNENLVYRAAKLLLESCKVWAGLKITLVKNIPAGSGLGSGSSDAAATLMGIDRLLKLRVGRHRLMELGQALGSDVPFFLNGPLALCTGTGEKIRELEREYNFCAVLVLPDVNVATSKVYANYRHNEHLYGELHTQITGHIERNRIDLAAEMCANMLQGSCFSLVKELAEIKRRIESLGMEPLCLTGSGSAMFHIARNEQDASTLKTKIIERVGCKSVIVKNNRW